MFQNVTSSDTCIGPHWQIDNGKLVSEILETLMESSLWICSFCHSISSKFSTIERQVSNKIYVFYPREKIINGKILPSIIQAELINTFFCYENFLLSLLCCPIIELLHCPLVYNEINLFPFIHRLHAGHYLRFFT